jgi:hypothetical protein
MNVRHTGDEGFHQEAWRIPLDPVIMLFPFRYPPNCGGGYGPPNVFGKGAGGIIPAPGSPYGYENGVGKGGDLCCICMNAG